MIARALALPPIAAALLAAALAGCSKAPPGPRIAAGERAHDFGPLWIGEVVRHPFRIRNEGDRPLVLGAVRSTCGCLLHEISDRNLAPGETAEIVAELHADKGPGPLTKMLRIATNDPALPWLDLTLSADLRTLYQLEPPLLDVADLVLGEPRDLVVKLAVQDGSALSLGTPECPEKGFSASVRGATAGAAEIAEIIVRFGGSAGAGRRLFRVSVPTGHPRVPAATVPVQAIILPRLLVEPGDRVDFGEVRRAEGARVELRVRHRGRDPIATPTASVHVSSAAAREDPSAAPQLRTGLETVEPGHEWKLVVELPPHSPGGSLVGRVVVRAEAPDEPPVVLTLTGRIVD